MTANIYLGDCMDVLRNIPDGSIDLMLTDPPYAVTQNKWDVKIPLKELWAEWERVLKPNGAFVFTSQFPFTIDLIMSNRDLFRYDLIWYKPLGSGFLNANKMPLRNHEHILVFYRKLPTYNPQKGIGQRKKGKVKNERLNSNYGKFNKEEVHFYDDNGIRNPQSVIEITNGDRTSESDHPTQKPVELFQYLIKTYSNEGDTVFDGYLGSGTCAHACLLERRSFIGAEFDPTYYVGIKKRIQNHVQQLPLFGPPPIINFHE
jgi:site-specific DNA-methyltransferase (adenine-specific)